MGKGHADSHAYLDGVARYTAVSLAIRRATALGHPTLEHPLALRWPAVHLARMSDSGAITRLNAALEGRSGIESELGEGGMATGRRGDRRFDPAGVRTSGVLGALAMPE